MSRLPEPLGSRPGHAAEDDVLAADDDVLAAINALPVRQRTVLVLRYYVGHSDREIAGALGCRESSVRSLAARAFASLRPVLRPATAERGVTR